MISISCQCFHRFIMDVCTQYTFTYLLAVGKHQSFDVRNMNREERKKPTNNSKYCKKTQGTENVVDISAKACEKWNLVFWDHFIVSGAVFLYRETPCLLFTPKLLHGTSNKTRGRQKNPIKSIVNSNSIYLCISLQALWQIDIRLSTVWLPRNFFFSNWKSFFPRGNEHLQNVVSVYGVKRICFIYSSFHLLYSRRHRYTRKTAFYRFKFLWRKIAKNMQTTNWQTLILKLFECTGWILMEKNQNNAYEAKGKIVKKRWNGLNSISCYHSCKLVRVTGAAFNAKTL